MNGCHWPLGPHDLRQSCVCVQLCSHSLWAPALLWVVSTCTASCVPGSVLASHHSSLGLKVNPLTRRQEHFPVDPFRSGASRASSGPEPGLCSGWPAPTGPSPQVSLRPHGGLNFISGSAHHGLETNSSEAGTVPSETRMHGGTDQSPSMHLDSQHAPGFPAAAVAAIGQAGGLGGSWGLLSCSGGVPGLFCPLSIIMGHGRHLGEGGLSKCRR